MRERERAERRDRERYPVREKREREIDRDDRQTDRQTDNSNRQETETIERQTDRHKAYKKNPVSQKRTNMCCKVIQRKHVNMVHVSDHRNT